MNGLIMVAWLWSPALAVIALVALVGMLIGHEVWGHPRDWRWLLLPAVPLVAAAIAGAFLLISFRNLAHM